MVSGTLDHPGRRHTRHVADAAARIAGLVLVRVAAATTAATVAVTTTTTAVGGSTLSAVASNVADLAALRNVNTG